MFYSKTELYCRMYSNSPAQPSGMKSMKSSLGYRSFSLFRVLIFFEIDDDYSLPLEDLAEINCCSASLKCRYCMKILNLGFRHPPLRTLIWKHLQWWSGPEGVLWMVHVLLCSVTVENVKESDSWDHRLYFVQYMLMIFCKSCFTGCVLTV